MRDIGYIDDAVNRDALIKFYNALSNERKVKFMGLVNTLSGLLTKNKNTEISKQSSKTRQSCYKQ